MKLTVHEFQNCDIYNYHSFTETEGNSVFCWSATAVDDAKPRATTAVEGPQNTLLSIPEVSVNKCFVIKYISVKVWIIHRLLEWTLKPKLDKWNAVNVYKNLIKMNFGTSRLTRMPDRSINVLLWTGCLVACRVMQ